MITRYRQILLIAIIFCLTALGQAQSISNQQPMDKNSETIKQVYQQREQAITAALSTTNEWAGEYYQGDHLGANITVKFDGQTNFVYQWTGCMGVYDLNYGQVDWQSDQISLKFELPNNSDGIHLDNKFYLIKWQDRHYLIPERKIIEFCNDINAGSDGNTKMPFTPHLLKVGDESKPVTGRPTLPAQYQQYLLPKPVNTKITAVNDSKIVVNELGDLKIRYRISKVTIDAGSAAGLLPGMKLHNIAQNHYEEVTIKNCQQHSAEAMMIQDQPTDDDTPAAGWQYCTHYRD